MGDTAQHVVSTVNAAAMTSEVPALWPQEQTPSAFFANLRRQQLNRPSEARTPMPSFGSSGSQGLQVIAQACAAVPPAHVPAASVFSSRTVLDLASMIEGRELPTGRDSSANLRSLPTVGSAGHDPGTCKPCAFMWKSAG